VAIVFTIMKGGQASVGIKTKEKKPSRNSFQIIDDKLWNSFTLQCMNAEWKYLDNMVRGWLDADSILFATKVNVSPAHMARLKNLYGLSDEFKFPKPIVLGLRVAPTTVQSFQAISKVAEPNYLASQ
jgi:hypothetical protein